MRRATWLIALLIALFAAAACATSGQRGGSGTSAGSATAPAAAGTATAAGSAPQTATRSSAAMWSNPPGVPDPGNRMLLGAYVNLSGQSSTMASVRARESAMGRPYDLLLTYYNWTDPFPDADEAAIVASGSTPLMAWYLPDKYTGSTASLSAIASGADDALISTQAQAIKAFGHRVYLRFAPEMNGSWYHYSDDPTAYVAAWRHVWNLFRQAGVTNVTWVWCPNLTPAGDWDPYYPGSAYVDVIGVDSFSNVKYTWQTFQKMFEGFFAHFAAFAPGKPQMVVETATNSGRGTPVAGVGSAASFISGMRSYLKDVAGPKYNVIGVCWFDSDTNDGINWRVDQTAQSWQAWVALARDPYFGGHGP
jgi:mannan endo-1,4-beta-mannosidase